MDEEFNDFHLTDMDYFVAALAQAHFSGMDLIDVLKAAQDSRSAQAFDARINSLSDHVPDGGIRCAEDFVAVKELLSTIPGLLPEGLV